ncbi:MAG: TonB-dependent receptor, partial [Blastocatellia bacterium]|nr:TonB-dependent receptor [Blastocatellia bacterium]
ADYKQDKIVVEVGRLTNLDAALKVAGAAESVEVVGTLGVNTESKEFASNVNQTAINDLPINGRRWSNFVILTPGVVPDGSFGLLSFRGISGLLNNNTVDGGDNNQAFFSEERGRTRISYSISQSAVQEFQVNTSNYSAEYGRAAGGVTNAVTKSGTNQFHGDAFYFQRNNDWGARNPLATQTVLNNGVPTLIGIKPHDIRHQFGGTLGGPVIKDKLFFFFSYDQQKRNFPGLGIFNNTNYLNTVNRTTNPASSTFGASLKNPTRNISDAQIADAQNFLTQLTGTVPRQGDQKLLLPKIDWQINNKNTFTVTYNRLRWDSPAGIQTQATNTRGRASFGDDFVKVDSGTGRLISTLTPSIINEFRFQYSRDFEFEFSQPPLSIEPQTGPNGSAPDVFLTGGLEFGKPTFLERGAFPDERRSQIADNVTLSRGINTIKFGMDVNHVRDIISNLRNESGAYSYNNINDFIIDYANWKNPFPANTIPCSTNPAGVTKFAGRCYTSNYAQGFGPLGTELATNDYDFYAQYDWKFRPRVTINLGLRYEYESMPGIQFANPSTALIPNTNMTLNQATSNLPSDKNNFGPRVGFAADLTGDGKTSLRGGYGIYYGRIINSTIYNALLNTGAAGGQVQVSIPGTSAASPIFPFVFPSNTSAASLPQGSQSIQFFSPDFQNPTIHQGDLVFERELFKDTTFSASYLISIGRKLPTFLDQNLFPPTTTRTYAITGGPFDGQTVAVPAFTVRPNSNFAAMTEIASLVSSQYHAMVLQINRRFSKGLQFNANYTLSKATDYNQGSVTFTVDNVPFNAFDLNQEYGRSSFDRRHKFIANAVYTPRVKLNSKLATNLLDNWGISPIVQFYTGIPYNITTTGNIPGGISSGGINGSAGANRLPLSDRNSLVGPNVFNVDLRLSRTFNIKDIMNIEILGEAFNLFNRTQVTGINTLLYQVGGTVTAPTLTPSATAAPFGSPSEAGGTLYRERQIQIGARIRF